MESISQASALDAGSLRLYNYIMFHCGGISELFYSAVYQKSYCWTC